MKKLTVLLFALFMLASPSLALAATLSLSPASGTFNKNCNFSLEVILDTTGSQTDGTDAILLYDASRFTANSITSGSIYPDYPGNNIDETGGKITISGLASVTQAFSGKGTLATVNFTVKDNALIGATQIKFDFDPNEKAKTTDSNVVERSTVVDVLNSVVNGNYTIGSGTSCAVPAPSILPGTGSTGQGAVGEATPSATAIPMKTLPPAGSEQLTFTLTIIGVTLTIFGILGLALL